jgi:NAD(P)-dependent dehydrogenase (short-subunit alcohol dehydrogenase family)
MKGEKIMELKGKKVLIVGGSSGIGLGVAKAAKGKGANVMIVGRSKQKLDKAAAEIGGDVKTAVLDAIKEEEVKAFFAKADPFDHLVTSIHDARPETLADAFQPVSKVSMKAARSWMETKFWGQIMCAKYGEPKLSERGSITLSAGIASKRYVPVHGFIAPTNAAVGAFAWLFSHEIGTKRCNAVAAGLVYTPAYDFMPENDRKAFFDNYAEKFLPVKHVATPEEMAKTYIYLMESDYHTGDVICCDGGLWSAKG